MAYGSMTMARHRPRKGMASLMTSATARPIASLQPIDPAVKTNVLRVAIQKVLSLIRVA